VLFQFTSFFSSQSLEERTLYQQVSYETISDHPLGGVGIGQFVLNSYKLNPNLESWQYQPVHNVYLLIFSELGIVGFISFLLLLAFGLSKFLAQRTVINPYYVLTDSVLRCIILSFLLISSFDHYFWDIKIGLLIFLIPVILFLSIPKSEN